MNPQTAAYDSNWWYSNTLEFLEKYQDTLNPWRLFWPDYDAKELLMDFNWYVHVSVPTLIKIQEYVEGKAKLIKNISSTKVWISFATQTVKDLEDLGSEESIFYIENEQLNYSDKKIRLYDHTAWEVKDLYEKRISRDIEIYDLLLKRIRSKFLVSEETAKAWMNEYFRFMLIFTHSLEKSFPWQWVEKVWTTHMEFSKEYKSYWVFLFGRMIYPHNYHLLEDWNDDLLELYKRTLSEYKDLLGIDPPNLYWESVEKRFNEEEMRIVSFSIYRYQIMRIFAMKKP